MKIRTSSYVAVGAAVGLALGAFAYTGITASRPGVQQVARTAADGTDGAGAVPADDADDAGDDGEVVLQGVQPAVDTDGDASPEDDATSQDAPTTAAPRPRPATSSSKPPARPATTSTTTSATIEPPAPTSPTTSPTSPTTPPRDDD